MFGPNTAMAIRFATADSKARFCACAGSPMERFAGGASTRIAMTSMPRLRIASRADASVERVALLAGIVVGAPPQAVAAQARRPAPNHPFTVRGYPARCRLRGRKPPARRLEIARVAEHRVDR